ncbi:MAG: hypothetical protein ACFFDS_07830 [Candidatus Thorarchaeota archaeon]
MKKKYIALNLATFFILLFTILPVAQAKPHKHVTYGDAMASFKSVGAFGIELRGLGSEHMFDKWKNFPAPITFDERIYPWDDANPVRCEHDAFFISAGISIWSSDFDFFGLTVEDMYQMREDFEFEFYIDGVQLETVKNPIKPVHFIQYVSYGDPEIPDGYLNVILYTWNQGRVFKAGELDAGFYELNTKMILSGFLLWEWTITFEIAECWH